jgi:DNA invertase Pin-like site-specific DNA recombinase
MMHPDDQPADAARPRAVAYYRHSAQDRQEDSIEGQRGRIREWAETNGVEIIEEFADAGEPGLDAEDRLAFTEMMEQWVKQKDDFQYVLCVDATRWGRFDDIGTPGRHAAECERHGKQIIYTTTATPREDALP